MDERQQEVYEFLDDLRESGITNMFEIGPYGMGRADHGVLTPYRCTNHRRSRGPTRKIQRHRSVRLAS